MGSNWLKNTIRGVLISAVENVGDAHRVELTSSPITATKNALDTFSRFVPHSDTVNATGDNWYAIATATSGLAVGDTLAEVEIKNAASVANGGLWFSGCRFKIISEATKPELQVDFYSQNPTLNSVLNGGLNVSEGSGLYHLASITVGTGEWLQPSTTTNIIVRANVHVPKTLFKTSDDQTSIWAIVSMLSATQFGAASGRLQISPIIIPA